MNTSRRNTNIPTNTTNPRSMPTTNNNNNNLTVTGAAVRRTSTGALPTMVAVARGPSPSPAASFGNVLRQNAMDTAEMRAILAEVETLDREFQSLLHGPNSPLSPSPQSPGFDSQSSAAFFEGAVSTLTGTAYLSSPVKRAYLPDVTEQVMETLASVDVAMRLMDMRYRTSFTPWILDEGNVDAISQHLKRFLADLDVPTMARGLAWMTDKWSVNASSTLLIKLFYEQGLADPRFIQLVQHLCQSRTDPKIAELVGTLLIGEDPQLTAKFLSLVSHGWPEDQAVDVVQSISATSRWTPAFLEEFLVYFSVAVRSGANDSREPVSQSEKIAQIQEIKQLLAARPSALTASTASRTATSSGTGNAENPVVIRAATVEVPMLQRQQTQAVLRRILQQRPPNPTQTNLATPMRSSANVSLNAGMTIASSTKTSPQS